MSFEVGLSVPIDATPAQRGASDVNRALDSMAAQADSSLARIRNSLNSLEGSIFSIKNAFLGIALGEFSSGILDAELAMNRIKNTLVAATGSAALATVQYDELRDVVNRLALDLPTTAQNFAQMAAAARGTSMEGEKVLKVFEGVATAGTALGLSARHVELTLYAVQQMISQGMVSMKELRRQLGDNLPGAFQIAAESMGVTTRELTKMVREGKVVSAEFLPKFAEILEKRFAPAALLAANQTQGLINRLKTAAFEFKNFIAQSGFGPALDDAIRRVTQILNSDDLKQAAKNVGKLLGDAVGAAATAFEFLARHSQAVLVTLEAYTGLKVTLFFVDLASKVAILTKEFLALGAVQSTLGFLSPSVSSASSAAGAGVNLSQYKTKAGKLLSSSQFAARSASSSFAGDAEEFAALQFLHGGGGQLLNQSQLNAKLASNAYESLNFNMKTNVSLLASQLGLQAAVSSSFKNLALGALSSARAFLTMAVSAPISVLKNLATTAVSSGGSLIAAALALPGWLKLLAVVAAVGTGLYMLRDVQIKVAGENARVGTITRGVWETIKSVIQSTAQDIGDYTSKKFHSIVDVIKSSWLTLKDVLREPFMGVIDYLESTWQGQLAKYLGNFVTTAYNAVASKMSEKLSLFAQFGKTLETLDKAGATQGNVDPITGQRIAAPNPAKAIIDAQIKNYKPRVLPKDIIPPTDSALNYQEKVKKDIQVLQEQINAQTKSLIIAKDLTTTDSQNAIAIAKATEARKAEDLILQLNANIKNKLNDSQKQDIRDKHEAIAVLEVMIAAQKKYKDLFQSTDISTNQQKQLNAALSVGEVMTNKVRAAQIAENAVRQFKGILDEKEIERLRQKIVLEEQERQKQQYISEAKALNETYDASKRYATQLEHLEELRKSGILTSRAYSEAVKQLQRDFDAQVDEMLARSTRGTDGILLFLREYERQAKLTAQNVRDAFSNAFTSLQDEMVKFLDTGKFKFSNFLDSLKHEIDKMLVQKIFGNLFGVLLGGANAGNASTTGNPGAGGATSPGGILGTILTGLGGLGRPGTPSTFPPGVVIQNLQKNVTTSFGQTATDTTKNFKDMIDSMGGFLKNLFTSIADVLKKLFSGISGSGGSSLINTIIGTAIGTGIGKSTSKNEMGNIMTSSGPLRLNQFTNGGVATSPQLSLFGEGRVPEAYVPLPDGRSIPVTMKGAGASNPPSVKVVVINKSGTTLNAQQQSSKYDSTLREAVVEILLTEQIENGASRRAGIGRSA